MPFKCFVSVMVPGGCRCHGFRAYLYALCDVHILAQLSLRLLSQSLQLTMSLARGTGGKVVSWLM